MRSMGVYELATSSTGAGSSESAESSEGTGGGCVVPTRLMGGCEPAFSLADARGWCTSLQLSHGRQQAARELSGRERIQAHTGRMQNRHWQLRAG